MKEHPSPDRIERQLRFLRLYALASSLALAGLLLAAFAPALQRVEVLEVERINVVDEDGRTALVIAARGSLPGPMFERREYPQQLSGGRVDGAGMIFFNERGDEVGGLTYRGRLTERGHAASAGLAFDQFRQDQAIAISYDEVDGERLAALRVWDRPETSIAPVVDRLWEVRQMPAGPERDAALADARRQVGGVVRLTVGKTRDRAVGVLLADAEGRPRLRMQVDAAGAPVLEFLDEGGTVVQRLPDAGR